MARDEFNIERITNEGKNPNFEFGNTQDNESTSYFDNDDRLRDEINDNPASNNENKSPEKKKKRRKEKQKERSNKSSNGSGTAGAGRVTAVGATVVAAVSIATGIVSVGARPSSPEVDKVVLTPHETSINCGFDIFNTDSTIKYKVELHNDEIEQYFEEESKIGHNELEFTDLEPSTVYTFEILRGNPNKQQEYDYQSIYSKLVTTLEIPAPIEPSEPYIISFNADHRGGTMSSIKVDANSEYSLPACIFAPFDDEYFGGWKVNGELHQPGETIVVNSDTTLVAGWNKFPTKENTVPANSNNFFYLFPEQPSTNSDTITLMGVDFLYKNTYYSSSSQSLNIINEATSAEGFVSTTAPFGGPISSITITTSTSQSGDVDFTMVYSDSPIYEKVTDQGETHTLAAGSTYTFECTNPDARYFCLSNAVGSRAFISSMKFVYNTPKIENSFTIYFDANGGIGSCDPYVVKNTNKELIPTIQRIENITPQDGYKFSGWKIEGADDLLTPGTKVGIYSDVTLVAQWEPTDLLTVRLDANGGSFYPIYPNQVQMNEIVTLPGEEELSSLLPPAEGYVFDGWSQTPDGSSPVSYDYQVTKNVTLYIRWRQTGSYSLGNYLYLLTGDNTAHQVNIEPLGINMYIKSMEYINDATATESRFNVSDGGFLTNYSENQGEIISVTVVLSKAIKMSVSFSENTMYQWNYDETSAHEYTCLDGDESYEFFPSSSAGACTYFNISAEENSDYTVVKDIIVKYKIS